MVLHRLFVMLVIALGSVISGCGGGGGGSATSGNSDIGAPSSIIGFRLVETVSASGYVPSPGSSGINITQPGGTLT